MKFVCLASLLAVATAPATAQRSNPVSTDHPPGSDEWYLPVDSLPNARSCRLYVLEFGHGPDTVVVLHGGFGAEYSYLLPAVSGLEDRYHWVFYDQRGSLRSPCPDSLITLQRHLDDLDRLRSALGLRRMTLLAHSMGTFAAMAYLQAHPDAVANMVLVGSLQPASPLTQADSVLNQQQDSTARAFISRPEVAHQLQVEGLDKPRAEMSARDITHAWRIHFAAVNIYHMERWRQMRGGQVFYSAAAAEAAARTMPPTWDFVPALAHHSCPITVIAGDHDFVDMGAIRHRRWTAGLRNVDLVILKDAGHNPWIDAPAEFRRAVVEALERSCASG